MQVVTADALLALFIFAMALLSVVFKLLNSCVDATVVATELEDFGCRVDIYDPWASPEVVRHEYGKELIAAVDPAKKYEAIVACVSHNQFMTFDFKKYREQGAVIFDVKGFVSRELVDARL